MSIALDTALYLREQHSDNPLTLAERGLLFTLMFRVGSNPYAWVSQNMLAAELDIAERNVKRLLASIKKKGFIVCQIDPHDKRRNLYRPAEFLINYHQQNNRKVTKKKGIILSPKSRDRGQNYPLNRGQNYPLSSKLNKPKDVELKEEIKSYPQGKDTIENNIKENKRENRVEIPTWLNTKNWEEFKRFRKEIKAPMSVTSERRAIGVLITLKEKGNDPVEVINQSIVNGWRGLFEIRSKSRMNFKEEIRSTVKFWGPGHPDYDRLHA